MKFIFADSLDYVDPNFDFEKEEHSPTRNVYWDDKYPHEMINPTPYDGILVSRAIVGTPEIKGRYTESQAMRFARVGAPEFLRFNSIKYKDKMVIGDNGAFSYSKLEKPPFTVDETIEFYEQGQFTHGCSLDHIVFEFDCNSKNMEGGTEESRNRYQLTQDYANEFINKSRVLTKNNGFEPIGVIQGWSPDSMAHAAVELIRMGYRYLAIGGLVPLKISEIHIAVSRVSEAINRWSSSRIHLLGFAKAGNLLEFKQYKKLASFDSSSPLIKAFKDDSKNYFKTKKNGEIVFYKAIRIPQALENNKLKNDVKHGYIKSEKLLSLEKECLRSIRHYDKDSNAKINDVIDPLIEYTKLFLWNPKINEETLKRKLHNLRISYEKTLTDKPWQSCNCEICRNDKVEVIIFRGSNRNKRRGFHNLASYYEHLKQVNTQ